MTNELRTVVMNNPSVYAKIVYNLVFNEVDHIRDFDLLELALAHLKK